MITIKATMTPKSPGKKIRSIKKQLEDRREVMEQSKQYLINRWNADFASGKGMAPNSTWKEGGSVMHGDTGALAGYFYPANQAGVVTNATVHWHFQNDGDQYSATHSTSGINPNPLKGHKPIPQRVLWEINGTDQTKITRMVEQWIAGKVTF